MVAMFERTVTAFRLYDDDAGEAASAPLQAQDVAHTFTITADQPFQLRFLLEETGGISGTSMDDYALEYSKNSGAFVALTTTDVGDGIRAVAAGLTNDAATTNRTTNGINDPGSGSFVAGEQSSDGIVDDMLLTAGDYTEHVYGIEIVDANVSDTDFFDIRFGGGIVNLGTAVRVTVSKATGGQTIAVDQAVETDTAQKINPRLILNQAIETNTAQVINPDLAAPQNIAVNQAVETDIGQKIDARLILNQAIEADLAQKIAAVLTINQAVETDIGQVVTPDLAAGPQTIPVTQAIETNTAQKINPRVILNQAVEADTAQQINPQLILGIAVETDTGLKLDPILIINQAIETDTALVINPDLNEPVIGVVNQAVETDAAGRITPVLILSQAVETDTALPILPTFSVDVVQAVETDLARKMTPVLTIGQAVETNLGLKITPILTIGLAIEANTAQTINPRLILQQAVEADTALNVVPVLTIGQAIETNTAQAITVPAQPVGDKYNAMESFPTGQNDVTITLYDPLTGLAVSLSSDACLEIEATGMYVWGNNKLTVQPIGYKEFMYQMTDGVTTVDNILRMPQFELVEHLKALEVYGL